MEVEVEALPCNRESQAVDEVRTAGGTDGALVASVDDTVAIDTGILHGASLASSEGLRGRVAYVFRVLA